jgi:hypothetical protein
MSGISGQPSSRQVNCGNLTANLVRGYCVCEIRVLNRADTSVVIHLASFDIGPGRLNQFSNRCQVFFQAAHEDIIVVGSGDF